MIHKQYTMYSINPQKGAVRPSKKYCIVFFALLSIISFVFAQTTAYKIYIIGDSTVCNYGTDQYPWAGWGQVLSKFFKSGTVVIDNRAIGGRSSKSFYVEGRWTTLEKTLKTGDFVLIQFGHNDRDYSKEERYADTTLYKTYLRLYVTESRAKGAIPVFVSPMNMNTWNGTTLREVFTERDKGADYRGAMMNIAAELKVPFIDLEKKSATFMKTVGQAYCTSYHFMGLQKGEYPNFPDGNSDGTHFQEMGALANARMVTEGIKELASHADVGKLAAVLAPLNKVTVNANKASAGLVTVSGDYPQGVTVTVKVTPNSGETFQNWSDASGKSVTTSKLFSFTMGSVPTTYNALFKGGSAVAVIGQNNKSQDYMTSGLTTTAIRIRLDQNILIIAAGSTVKSIELFDLHGNLLIRSLYNTTNATADFNDFSSGLYCVRVKTESGISNHKIELR